MRNLLLITSLIFSLNINSQTSKSLINNNLQVLIPYSPNINPDDYKSNDYSVFLKQGNGPWIETFVYRTYVNSSTGGLDTFSASSFINFDFRGTVKVKIISNIHLNINDVKIRPLSKNFNYNQTNSNTIIFNLNKQENLSVEFNNNRHNGIHVFSNIPDEGAPLGAITIEDLNQAPLIDPLDINSGRRYEVQNNGEKIYLSGGDVFNGAIIINNKDDVQITGRGIINQSLLDKNYSGNSENFPINYSFLKGIRIRNNSNNILINGLIINDTQQMGIQSTESDSLTFKNVKIFTRVIWGDGMHFVACNNVVVENCFIRTSDDSMSIYPFRERDINENYHVSWHGNTTNYYVSNTSFYADKASAIKIGSHGIYTGFNGVNTTNDPDDDHISSDTNKALVENINFENIDVLEGDQNNIDNGKYLGLINLRCGDNNYCQFINFKNVNVEDFTQGSLLMLRVNKATGDSGSSVSDGYRSQNIVIDGLYYTGDTTDDYESLIEGVNECRYISNVTLNDFFINNNEISSINELNNNNFYVDNQSAFDIKFDLGHNYEAIIPGNYKIKNLANNKQLKESTLSNNANLNDQLVLNSFTGDTWDIQALGNDIYSIKNLNSNKYLTLGNGGIYDGTTSSCYDYYGITTNWENNELQKWKFISSTNNSYRIINLSGYELSLSGSPLSSTNTGNDYIFNLPWKEDSYQKWILVDPNVTITNKTLYYSSSDEISIYPNPAKNILNIDLTFFDKISKLNVKDLYGIVLLSDKNIYKKNQIDISNFKQGVYFLEFLKNDGSTLLYKFIKK